MIVRSLNVPGSPSAPLTTTVVASTSDAFSRIVRHLRPVGKPAPPRPRSPDASIWATIASASSWLAASTPRPPRWVTYSSRDSTGLGGRMRWTSGMALVLSAPTGVDPARRRYLAGIVRRGRPLVARGPPLAEPRRGAGLALPPRRRRPVRGVHGPWSPAVGRDADPVRPVPHGHPVAACQLAQEAQLAPGGGHGGRVPACPRHPRRHRVLAGAARGQPVRRRRQAGQSGIQGRAALAHARPLPPQAGRH